MLNVSYLELRRLQPAHWEKDLNCPQKSAVMIVHWRAQYNTQYLRANSSSDNAMSFSSTYGFFNVRLRSSLSPYPSPYTLFPTSNMIWSASCASCCPKPR